VALHLYDCSRPVLLTNNYLDFLTILPGFGVPAKGIVTFPPVTLVADPIAPCVGFDIGAGACVPVFIFHLPRDYAAPPIDASNDAMSGFPCGGPPCGPPAAGAAPPGCSILGCKAEAGAIPATGGCACIAAGSG